MAYPQRRSILRGMSRTLLRSRPVPREEFRCPGCGYGAVSRGRPARCPMCGCSEWEVFGWKPFSVLPTASVARIRHIDKAADEPLRREALEVASDGVATRSQHRRIA